METNVLIMNLNKVIIYYYSYIITPEKSNLLYCTVTDMNWLQSNWLLQTLITVVVISYEYLHA